MEAAGDRMRLNCTNVSHQYTTSNGAFDVLRAVSLSVDEGQIVSILGPSGCGKSTLLRLIAGMESPSTGEIASDGGYSKSAPPQIALLGQHDELLPYRTALQNVMLPAEVQGTVSRQSIETTRVLLEAIGLAGFLNQYPERLSGGMRQRCLLAMHLQIGAKLYLLDEPFSGLDSRTAERVSALLVARKAKHSFLLVLHDIATAAAISDVIYVLSDRPATVVATHVAPADLGTMPPVERRAHPAFESFLLSIIRSTNNASTGLPEVR